MNNKEMVAVVAMLKRHNVAIASLLKIVMRLAKDADPEAQEDVQVILSEANKADKEIKAMRVGEVKVEDEGFAPAGFYL